MNDCHQLTRSVEKAGTCLYAENFMPPIVCVELVVRWKAPKSSLHVHVALLHLVGSSILI